MYRACNHSIVRFELEAVSDTETKLIFDHTGFAPEHKDHLSPYVELIMKLIYEFNPSHLDALYDLYQNEWWSKGRSRDEIELCVTNSQVVIGLVDVGGGLKGFARILTDYIYKALIFDVIVASELRGVGAGKQLMAAIIQHPQLKEVNHMELYCLPEMVAFYRQFGFGDDVGDIKLLRAEKNDRM